MAAYVVGLHGEGVTRDVNGLIVTAEYWQRFIHIVDDVEPSGILLPTTVEEPWMVFDINGKRWPHLKSGVNIIKYKNGETKKKYVQ